MQIIDIRQFDNALDAINSVINNGNVAEVKVEKLHLPGADQFQLTIVEQTRRVKDVERMGKECGK